MLSTSQKVVLGIVALLVVVIIKLVLLHPIACIIALAILFGKSII